MHSLLTVVFGLLCLFCGAYISSYAIKGVASGDMLPAPSRNCHPGKRDIINRDKHPVKFWFCVFCHAVPGSVIFLLGIWMILHPS